jgi:Co/Zn/Cd efflux system component
MTCGCEAPRFDGASVAYRRVLWLVIAINAGMFATETVAGWLAGSVALQADALDFAGDSFTYGLSLFVIGRSARLRASAALFKGLSLGAMGLWVFGFTVYRVFVVGVPDAVVMGAIGFLALAANVGSALLLMRYRAGDANVRSVWLCSRNDAIGNLAVVGAAGLVALSGAAWPDFAVAAIMALLFLNSATQIVRQALGELRTVGAPAGDPVRAGQH